MIVAFCGHRTLHDEKAVQAWLEKLLPQLIREGADTFYVGGKGAFDRKAAAVAMQCKAQHPHIRVTLVQAYIDQMRSPELHDDTLYPPLESVPPRFAITRRNEYMLRAADVVVAYVMHSASNSVRNRDFALRLGKRVICYPERTV